MSHVYTYIVSVYFISFCPFCLDSTVLDKGSKNINDQIWSTNIKCPNGHEKLYALHWIVYNVYRQQPSCALGPSVGVKVSSRATCHHVNWARCHGDINPANGRKESLLLIPLFSRPYDGRFRSPSFPPSHLTLNSSHSQTSDKIVPSYHVFT